MSNAASRYVAKISMLRLNIGSGMLRLSSWMLRLSLTSSVRGGGPAPAADEVRLSLSMHELSLSMPDPMLSLSMLILATYPVAALDVTIRTQNEN